MEPNDEDDPLRCVETLEGLCVEPKLAFRAETVESSSPGVSHARTHIGFAPILGSATLGLARVPVANDAAQACRRQPACRRRPVEPVAKSAAHLRAQSILLRNDGAGALCSSWNSGNWGTQASDLLKRFELSFLSASSRYRSPRLPGVVSSSFSSSSSQGSLSGIAKCGSASQALPKEHAAADMAPVSWQI